MSIAPYLTAKRRIDDRSLNNSVLEQFATELAAMEPPVRVLEVGAGTGTMVARLAARDLLPENVEYRAIDREGNHTEAALEQVPEWLTNAGYETSTSDRRVVATRGERELTVLFETADAFEIEEQADAIIAGAFLDLVELPDGLSRLTEHLVSGGLLYAPITYDGLTGFVPAHPLDETVEQLYHRHMLEIRDQPGGPKAGRQLLESIPDVGGTVLAAGGSDWVICPEHGGYPGDEQVVVEHLVETIIDSLSEFPAETLNPDSFSEWATVRRGQVESGELTYIAHNLDVLARMD